MGLVAVLDILGACGAFVALLSIFWIKRQIVGNVAKFFLTVAIVAYLFIAASNAVEHLELSGMLDPFEDYAEILFFPFVLFFVYATWVKQEITRRMKLQQRAQQVNDVLRTVQQVNELIVREDDRQKLIERACHILVQARGFRSAWLAVLNAEGQLLTAAQENMGDDYAQILNELHSGSLPTCVERALEERGVMKVEQYGEPCEICPLSPEGRNYPYLVTRIEHAARLHGVLVVCGEANASMPEEEFALFQELADDLGLALHKFELEQEREYFEAQFLQAQKMEAVGRLAGGIAHDFRNQLTVIGGYCDLLLRQIAPDSHLREHLSEIHKAAQRSEILTGQLLAFGRKQILQPQAININAVIKQIENPMASMLGDDAKLSMSLAEDLGTTELDRSRLEQAVMNIVANARDAMPEGGQLYVETENAELTDSYNRLHPEVKPGPYVVLTIHDTGVGMSKEVRERIFEPFFTTKERGKGTGLGLSMVYGFVKQSGGSIVIDSEPGQGTIFKSYFPGIEVEATANTSQVPLEQRHSQGKETILLVEDDDLVRGLAGKILGECGYSLLESAGGEQAISLAKEYSGKIDLLLSDVVMPGTSGPELAEKLLADRPEMKVLFISGYTADVIDRHGLARLGADLLHKPFSTTALVQATRRALDAGSPKMEKC